MNLAIEVVSAGIWSSNVSRKGQTVSKRRKTSMFELEIPTEVGGVSYIDSESRAIDTDILIFAKPWQARHTKFPFKCYYLHFDVKCDELCEKLSSLPNFIEISDKERYIRLFSEICKYHDSGDKNDVLMRDSRILELLYRLIHDAGDFSRRYVGGGGGARSIESVVKYIKENLTDDLSLAKISERAGFSETHFHNVFKTAVGKTLREFVENERIKHATHLLVTENMTLTEIAYECGFCSQSYFSYAFKRRMGMSPREYAKKLLTKYEEN